MLNLMLMQPQSDPPPPLLLHKRGDEIFKKMALMWGMEVLLQMGGGEPGMGGGWFYNGGMGNFYSLNIVGREVLTPFL